MGFLSKLDFEIVLKRKKNLIILVTWAYCFVKMAGNVSATNKKLVLIWGGGKDPELKDIEIKIVANLML